MTTIETAHPKCNSMYNDNKYLTFEVSGQTYGIQTKCIREVVPHGAISQVPDVPCFLLGVTNLRHEIIAIVDLQLLFGADKPTENDSKTCFIIANLTHSDGTSQSIGLVARRIYSARRILPDEIDAPPIVGGHQQIHYITGLGKDNDQVTILLDIDRLLEPEDKAIVAAIKSHENSSESGSQSLTASHSNE